MNYDEYVVNSEMNIPSLAKYPDEKKTSQEKNQNLK